MNIPYAQLLTATERDRWLRDLRIIVAEKQWEGCDGLLITDEVKATIAGHVALLLLGLDHDYFDNVLSILVYPTMYRATESVERNGLISRNPSARLGEAWYRGPVVLAWDEVLAAGRDWRHGHNVVLHEFAHALDFIDRSLDGTPPLGSREQYRMWTEVMTAEFQRLRDDVRFGRPSLLDKYGAKDEGEFFAVSTEAFFCIPVEVADAHPRLYQLLKDYYRQDPAARLR